MHPSLIPQDFATSPGVTWKARLRTPLAQQSPNTAGSSAGQHVRDDRFPSDLRFSFLCHPFTGAVILNQTRCHSTTSLVFSDTLFACAQMTLFVSGCRQRVLIVLNRTHVKYKRYSWTNTTTQLFVLYNVVYNDSRGVGGFPSMIDGWA